VRKKIGALKADVHTKRELVLWAENDQSLYRIQQAWENNFARKMRNGSFNRSLAIKGIANNFVPMIARDYKKHNGSIGSLTIADKRSIASKLIGDIINNARDKFKKMKPLKRKSTARRKSIFI
jgi:hypothetical protein